jgi:hypothetical protein
MVVSDYISCILSVEQTRMVVTFGTPVRVGDEWIGTLYGMEKGSAVVHNSQYGCVSEI